jgi:hypothetical protein
VPVELGLSRKPPENAPLGGTKIEEDMIRKEICARSTSFLRAIVAVPTVKTIDDPGN